MIYNVYARQITKDKMQHVVNRIVVATLVLGACIILPASAQDNLPPCSAQISCPCYADEVKTLVQSGDQILFRVKGTDHVSAPYMIK